MQNGSSRPEKAPAAWRHALAGAAVGLLVPAVLVGFGQLSGRWPKPEIMLLLWPGVFTCWDWPGDITTAQKTWLVSLGLGFNVFLYLLYGLLAHSLRLWRWRRRGRG